MEIVAALIGAVVGAFLGGLVAAYATSQGELRSARRTAYADFQVNVYNHCRDIDQCVASMIGGDDVPPLPSTEPIRHDWERINMLGPEVVGASARKLYEHMVAMDVHYTRPATFEYTQWEPQHARREELRADFESRAKGATVGLRAFLWSLVR